MDEQRIQEMIKFYNEREIQTLLQYHLQEQVQLFLMLIQDCLLLNKINIPLSKGLEMKNYREDILNNFIERYEKSSYYKGKSLKPQKSSIVLHERYLNMTESISRSS